jgi:two-component system, chemotaxis family, protein-glutamate methylesterase/glutaminase
MTTVAPHSPASFPVIAIASSAGGLSALSTLLSGLSPSLHAALVMVQHLDPRHPSLMAEILTRKSAITVLQAVDGDRLQPDTAFIAPPDHHMLVNPDGTLTLTQTKLVHFVRPSADLLFESVAASFKDRVIAVVLTGTGVDGAMGVQAVHKMGGTVLAQDESSAEFFGMPQAAIRTGCVDHVLPLSEIPATLAALIARREAHVGP